MVKDDGVFVGYGMNASALFADAIADDDDTRSSHPLWEGEILSRADGGIFAAQDPAEEE